MNTLPQIPRVVMLSVSIQCIEDDLSSHGCWMLVIEQPKELLLSWSSDSSLTSDRPYENLYVTASILLAKTTRDGLVAHGLQFIIWFIGSAMQTRPQGENVRG